MVSSRSPRGEADQEPHRSEGPRGTHTGSEGQRGRRQPRSAARSQARSLLPTASSSPDDLDRQVGSATQARLLVTRALRA